MNLGSHILVATGLSADPVCWLGSALPDLGSMRGFRLMGSSSNAAITHGIALHHRTDDAFHSSDWFQSRQRRLRTELDRVGLGRGAARAVAHVGPELLLDGVLLRSARNAEAVSAAMSQIPEVIEDLRGLVSDNAKREAFAAHLIEASEWDMPTDHDRPQAVARRLHRILVRRPRLGFDESEITLVENALEQEFESLADSAEELVEHITAEVSSVA